MKASIVTTNSNVDARNLNIAPTAAGLTRAGRIQVPGDKSSIARGETTIGGSRFTITRRLPPIELNPAFC